MDVMGTGTPAPVGGVERNQITMRSVGSSTLATGAGNGRAGSPFNAPGALAAMPAALGARGAAP